MIRAQVWSYGGGTQSVAIAVLISQGRLPMPEQIVIADTGRETRVTWEYTDAHIRPLLGVPIHVVPHDQARVDLYDAKGRMMIPAYANRDGQGRLPTYCSAEWKRDVISKWLRAQGYGPKRPVDMWMGISVDELHRAKAGRSNWLQHRYPLLFDVPMRRSECVALVMAAGLPRPPRSACWMCPHRSDATWRELRDERPDEWEQAIAFDADMRAKNPTLFLHRSMLPIAEAPIDKTEDGGGLWDQDGCDTGMCFV